MSGRSQMPQLRHYRFLYNTLVISWMSLSLALEICRIHPTTIILDKQLIIIIILFVHFSNYFLFLWRAYSHFCARYISNSNPKFSKGTPTLRFDNFMITQNSLIEWQRQNQKLKLYPAKLIVQIRIMFPAESA